MKRGKAKGIFQNNLGTKNFERREAAVEAAERIECQTALHKLARRMRDEGQTVNAHENLWFKGGGRGSGGRGSGGNRRLSLTSYGKLDGWRQFIFPPYQIRPVAVNPAYTSRLVPSEEDDRQGGETGPGKPANQLRGRMLVQDGESLALRLHPEVHVHAKAALKKISAVRQPPPELDF